MMDWLMDNYWAYVVYMGIVGSIWRMIKKIVKTVLVVGLVIGFLLLILN